MQDYIFSGHETLWLDLFSVTTLLFGIAVVINKNPIASLLCLIGLFGTIASYLIFIGLTFIGFSYLIVYIGAVSILFLFILMLINIRTSELQSNNSNSIPLALFITIVLDYILFEILPYQIAVINNYTSKIGNIFTVFSGGWTGSNIETDMLMKGASFSDKVNTSIMFVTSNSWDGNITETSHISSLGNILYTSYNMWLFLASLILLLAMVGSIIITIKQEN